MFRFCFRTNILISNEAEKKRDNGIISIKSGSYCTQNLINFNSMHLLRQQLLSLLETIEFNALMPQNWSCAGAGAQEARRTKRKSIAKLTIKCFAIIAEHYTLKWEG